jgi:CRISPR-associated protein Cmr2
MKHLFLLTIPTVQSFIKQARKTKDLYVGSQLLSDLIKCGAREFTENQNGTLIFPVSAEKEDTLTNRFLGEIEGETNEQLSEIGKAVKKAIQKHLIETAEQSVKEVIGEKSMPDGFEDQIKNLLDIKWAFMEWDGKPETYKEAYLEVEKLIGAIKNVRTFEQYNYQKVFVYEDDRESNKLTLIKGEQGRKCSIDGERNVKFYRLQDKETDASVLNKKLFIDNKEEICFIDNKVSPKYINSGEGLSAVSFFKRCYIPEKEKDNKDFAYPSTAKIALLQCLENIIKTDNQEVKLIFSAYKHYFNNEDFDAQLYFEENLTSDYFIKHGLSKYIPKLQEITHKHAKIRKYLNTKYYAIMVFDGDSMGKWLSGKYLVDKTKLYEFHKELSNCLSVFSKKVEKTLPENRGRTVYSGGDDFMGFVNLNYLFPVMKDIYELFDIEVNQKLKNNTDFQIKENENMTLSAGVAIAHYKTPLGIVLEKARAMEKLAKKDDTKGYKKDAFAIAVLKRSGEMNETVWKWKADKENFVTDIFADLVKKLQAEDSISNKFIKNSQLEFSKLDDFEPKYFNTEFKRLLKNSDDIQNEVYKRVEPVLPNENIENYNLQNFFMALNVADFIQRNTNPEKKQ